MQANTNMVYIYIYVHAFAYACVLFVFYRYIDIYIKKDYLFVFEFRCLRMYLLNHLSM